MSEEKEAIDFTPFNFEDDTGEPGPRPGLGGWGLPGVDGSRSSRAQLGPILGYCMEKVIYSFGLLRRISLEGDELQRSIQNLAVALPGQSTKGESEAKRKRSLDALRAAKMELASEADPLSVELLRNEDLLAHLNTEEKSELLAILSQDQLQGNLKLQSAVMHILRNAESDEAFLSMLAGLGGLEIRDAFREYNAGTFLAVAERFDLIPWRPPFHQEMFNASEDGDVSTEKDPLEALLSHIGDDVQPLINEDGIERFLTGDISAAELMGFNREELYMIAQRGYDLLQEGKHDMARAVFDGLVYLDPYDPYFYTVLGSVRQKQGHSDDAIACYTLGIKLQPWNINALANRGELLFNVGRLTDALSDFQRVLYYDPADSNPSTLRTKALLLAIKETVDQQTAAEASSEAPSEE